MSQQGVSKPFNSDASTEVDGSGGDTTDTVYYDVDPSEMGDAGPRAAEGHHDGPSPKCAECTLATAQGFAMVPYAYAPGLVDNRYPLHFCPQSNVTVGRSCLRK